MSEEELLTKYRSFLAELSELNKNEEDYFTIKICSYRLSESEIYAEIINCQVQYLVENKCPSKLQGPIIQNVIEQVREDFNSKEDPSLYGYDPEEKTFEPLKVRSYVLNKLKLFCQRLLDNVEFNKILPQLQCSTDIPLCAVGSVKNRRRYMEDRYICIDDFSAIYEIGGHVGPEPSFYAVFDGHDGFHAAYYAASQLPYQLALNPLFLTNPTEAIRHAFLSVDTAFVQKAYTQSIKGGTTVVCALYCPNEKRLYIAWVGDSKALLVKQGKMLQVVEPHKPENSREKKRITAAGGSVINWAGMWRVDGLLNISRAIGDSKCKPYVCAEPDIVALELDKEEDFLILACDGLWDHVREEDIASIVYKQLEEDSEDLQKITKRLIEKAKTEGSADNITIVVIFLKHPSQIAKSSYTLEVIEPQFDYQKLDLNSIDEEEIVDEEKILKMQYENGGQKHDEVDLLMNCLGDKDFNGFSSALINKEKEISEDLQKTTEEMQQSDAKLEEKFQEHFSSGKNFDSVSADDDDSNVGETNTSESQIDNPSEIGDESEEDEWNYIQLKEGKGEKKIIQSRVVSTKIAENLNQLKNEQMADDSQATYNLLDLNPTYVQKMVNDSLNKPTLQQIYEMNISEAEELDKQIEANNSTSSSLIEPIALITTNQEHLFASRLVNNDPVVAQSPRKGTNENMESIQVPDEIEFEYEADVRPHEIESLSSKNSKCSEIIPNERIFKIEANQRPHEIYEETRISSNKIELNSNGMETTDNLIDKMFVQSPEICDKSKHETESTNRELLAVGEATNIKNKVSTKEKSPNQKTISKPLKAVATSDRKKSAVIQPKKEGSMKKMPDLKTEIFSKGNGKLPTLQEYKKKSLLTEATEKKSSIKAEKSNLTTAANSIPTKTFETKSTLASIRVLPNSAKHTIEKMSTVKSRIDNKPPISLSTRKLDPVKSANKPMVSAISNTFSDTKTSKKNIAENPRLNSMKTKPILRPLSARSMPTARPMTGQRPLTARPTSLKSTLITTKTTTFTGPKDTIASALRKKSPINSPTKPIQTKLTTKAEKKATTGTLLEKQSTITKKAADGNLDKISSTSTVKTTEILIESTDN